jgi:hypothetical protein
MSADFSCATCETDYLILGDTQIAKDRALRDWPGCDCTTPAPHDEDCAATYARDCTCLPNDSLATMVPNHVDAGAPTSTVARSSAVEARDRATRLPLRLLALSRLQRIPASIRRRIAAWPFDDRPDYTT